MFQRLFDTNTTQTVFASRPSAWRTAGVLSAVLLTAGVAVTHAQASPTPKASVMEKNGWSSMIASVSGTLTPARERQIQALGGDIYRRLQIIHSVAVRIPTRNLKALGALPFLTHLSPDLAVRKCDEFTVASSVADQAMQRYNVTGQGVTVAVIDSGVQDVPDFKNRVVVRTNIVSADGAQDGCGHGTHVAGIIAGDGTSSTGRRYFRTFYGIAQQAQIASVRVLDGQGQGDVSSVVAGIQWTINHRSQYNIRVINLSLGHPVGESYTTDPLCQGVEAAWKAGIVVVCAAGNSGRLQVSPTTGADNEGYGTAYGSIESPGNDPYVITVGATKSVDGVRADDKIATYSSRGPSRLDLVLKPDIIAPGNQIISTLAKNSYLETAYGGSNEIPLSVYANTNNPDQTSNRYFQLSGTSMAAPVVAGAAALLLQNNPRLTPDTVKARLMATADKWVSSQGATDPCTYGAGYVDIVSALGSSLTTHRSALSPTLSRDAAGRIALNLNQLASNGGLWGTGVQDLRFIWGNSPYAGGDPDGGDGTDGSSTTLASSSIWSDSTLFSSSTSAVDLSSTALTGEH
jgi:serine protease AprX